jgi:hypothetical protein
MKLDEPRAVREVFEVESGRFEDVGAQLFPGVTFGEDGVAQGAGEVAPPLRRRERRR